MKTSGLLRLVLVVALCGLALETGSALAAELPGVRREFGSFVNPTGIAINQASGEVVVADSGANTVEVFSSEGGAPLSELTGTPSQSFKFSGLPVGVAVDNDPASSAYHDLYVADFFNNVVDRFRLISPGKYEYDCQIDGWYGNGVQACHETTGSPTQPFVFTPGVTTDSTGSVFISSYGPESGFISEFDAAGKGVMLMNSSEHGGFENHPAGLAVDPNGHLFVQNLEVDQEVVKFTLPSPGDGVPITGRAKAIAIDPTTNELFVDNGSYAEVFDSSGGFIEDLSSSPFDPSGGSRGIAVLGATREIYGSSGSQGNVRVIGPVKVPDVTLCKATAVTTTSVILTGEVNPLETEGAQYRFEYGPSKSYGLETSFESIAGNGLMPVSAEVTGLEPGATYHCRLDGTDTAGVAGAVINKGPDGTFETLPLAPVVDEEPAFASEVTATHAILNGVVNPGNAPTTYHFAYGLQAGVYTNSLPGVGIGTGLTPVAVEQSLAPASLTPSTTYHFALIATNSAGTVTGADEEFTTASVGAVPETPPAVSTGGAEAVTPNSATLTGTVDPQGTPTTYTFEAGTSTAYGTVLFGGEAGREHGAVPVSLTIGSLQPGVTYHYRLLATNAAGTTAGSDRVFTTPTFGAAIVQPAAPQLLSFPMFAFPTEPRVTAPKPLTNAQKLAKALKACKRKPKRKRAACVRQAHKRYSKHAKAKTRTPVSASVRA
jgi:NHL repeat